MKFEEAVKKAICELPNYDKLVEGLNLVGKNIDQLQEICQIAPGIIEIIYKKLKYLGIPVKPMLAKPTKGINIIFQRFEVISY